MVGCGGGPNEISCRWGVQRNTRRPSRSSIEMSARLVVPSPVGRSPTKAQMIRIAFDLAAGSRARTKAARCRRGGAGQQGTQNAGRSIEFGGFADPQLLRAPQCHPGAHTLRKPDHQKAEHHHDNQYLQQGEPALPARSAIHQHGGFTRWRRKYRCATSAARQRAGERAPATRLRPRRRTGTSSAE